MRDGTGARITVRRLSATALSACALLTAGVVGPVAVGASVGSFSRAVKGGAETPKGTTTLHSCTWSALEGAIVKGGTVVFACSGTIAPTTAITVSRAEKLVLDAAGESVVLMGHELKSTGGTNTVRLFVVDGGSLTLDHLTLEDSQVGPRPARTARRGRRARTESRARATTERTAVRGHRELPGSSRRAARCTWRPARTFESSSRPSWATP